MRAPLKRLGVISANEIGKPLVFKVVVAMLAEYIIYGLKEADEEANLTIKYSKFSKGSGAMLLKVKL
jgi:hypothetical protein